MMSISPFQRARVLLPGTLLLLTALLGCDRTMDNAAETFTVQQALPLEGGIVPTTAIDPQTGTTYVVFFRTEEEQSNAYLVRKAADAVAWSAPVRVNSLDGEASPHAQAPAQVAIGPAGAVYVAWTNAIPVAGRRFPASNLFFARSTDGGQTFSPQQAVNSDAEGRPAGHTFHDMTVGPDGTLYVAWLDGREQEAAQAEAEAAGTVRPVGTASGHAHEPPPVPGTQVWVASSKDRGLTFSAGTVVAREACQCCRTTIEVAGDGTLFVAWRHIFPNSERDIALATSTDGGTTFSAPMRVHQDGWAVDGCPHTGPSLAIDADGRVHLAWYTGTETNPALLYAVSADGGRLFSKPQTLVAGVPVSQVKLGGNRQARIWVAWEDKTTQRLRLAHTEGGGPLVEIEDAHLEAHGPALAVAHGRWAMTGEAEGNTVVLTGTSPAVP